jgi:hypothetical protein
MEPLKIVNRIVLQMSNDQAVVETKADLHSVEIFMIVQNWIENNQSHPRSSDAEVWLNAYELQNPNARPPRPKPVSKETQLTLKWIEKTVRHYRKLFGWSEEHSKRIILAAFPDLKPVLDLPEDGRP